MPAFSDLLGKTLVSCERVNFVHCDVTDMWKVQS